MVTIELTVDIAAPAEATWHAATSWTRQGEWMLGTRVWVSAGTGNRVGDGLSAFTGVGPLGFLDTMVITRWEPPHVCDVDHTGRLIRGTGRFEVQPTATGSRLLWREDLDLPYGVLGRLAYALGGAGFRWAVRRSLVRFARWTEAQALH
jgi:uncharacterized protein YndB with AHSA1/START domain